MEIGFHSIYAESVSHSATVKHPEGDVRAMGKFVSFRQACVT